MVRIHRDPRRGTPATNTRYRAASKYPQCKKQGGERGVANIKYTPEQRAEAINLYKTHGPTEVQKQLGIPKGTVTRWAQAQGAETVSVSVARAGTEAASAYAKRRRADLAVSLLDDAHRLREQLWLPSRLVNFGGKDNTLNSTMLDEPLFVDKKNILSAVGIAVDRTLKLDLADADNGVGATESMLQQLVDGVGIPDE